MKQVIMMFLLMVSTLLSVEAQIMSIYWLYPKIFTEKRNRKDVFVAPLYDEKNIWCDCANLSFKSDVGNLCKK